MSNRDVNFRLKGEDQTGSATKAAGAHFSALGGAINQANSAGGNATGVFGSLGGALGNMATVAGGIIAAQIFTRIADGIGSFITTGLGAVGQAQQLEASLKSLLTANNMYAQSTETLSVAISKTPGELADQAQKLNDLKLARQTDAAAIQEQKQRIIELTAAYGDNGLNVQTAKGRLAEMENQLAKTDSEIVNLSGSTTEYADVTKTAWGQVMSMEEAQRQAATQTRQLMDAISKLAVVSPFETESVEMVAKYAIAAGMGVKQTEDFTAGFLDMAASVGIGSENLGFAADQLLQVKKVGQLTTIDLRQLRRMGIDVSKVLGVEMGMSVDEFNAKAKTTPAIFDDLFTAMTRFSQNTFAGTSQAMATSVKGIQSTLSDVFTIGAREFFRPLVDAASPAANEIVGKLADMVLGGSMKDLGKKAAEMLKTAFSGGLAKLFASMGFKGPALFLKKLRELFGGIGDSASSVGDTIRTALGGALDWLQANMFPILSKGVDFFIGIKDAAILVFNTISGLVTAFQSGGLFGTPDSGGLLDALGMGDPVGLITNWAGQILAGIPGALTGITQGIATFLTENWPTISAALMEWSTKVWDWVKIAAAGAAGALIALGTAIVAWATSGEAQTSMNELGQNLGKMITDYMKLQFEGGEGATNALLALATGLVVAAASITGSLIILGGQLVAGILSGILASLGVDLKPATFNELSSILSGIGSNIATIASYVGSSIVTGIKTGWDETAKTISDAFSAGAKSWMKIITDTKWGELGANIIKGILKGINDNVSKVFEVIKSMAGTAISEALAAWGIHSPSTVFGDMGRQLVAGLVQGVSGATPNFQAALDKLLNLKTPTNFGGMLGQVFDDFEKVMDKSDLGRGKGKFLFEAFKKTIKANQGLMETASDETIRDLLQHAVGNWEKAGIKGAGEFAKQFVSLMRKQQKEMANQNGLTQAENFQKMLGGVGQFVGAATQEADNLNKKISVLNSLLRQGGDAFNVEGQIMNAAQAQERLNQLVAEQAGMQGALSGITGFQSGLQGFQEKKGLLGLLGAPAGQSAGDVIGGLSQLTGFLGRQIMGGMGGVGGNTQIINFSPTINTTQNEESILSQFYLLMSLIPSGT